LTERPIPREDGYTLAEVLAAVVVVGMVVVTITLALGSSKSDALTTACTARLRSVEESAEAVKLRTEGYPIGTVDASSFPNPLVAPAPGALLSEWPTSPDCVLQYSSTDGSAYTVDVIDENGGTIAGCLAL
jgi:type II secretory pathway pseudopilin PulG